MTYTFTHLSLEGLAIWWVLPKKLRGYYNKHRWEFITINIFAVLPDLDVLFGYHRSYTHSILIPVTLFLAMLIGEQFSKFTNTFDYHTQRFLRFMKLALLMWMLHIFLDFGWGPLMLFWPLNKNFYDLTVYFRFENKSWLFVPMTLLGIIPNWTILNFNEGMSSFFINLPQSEREQIYGHYVDFYIETVMLHVLLLILWLVIIFIPAFKRKQSEKRKTKKKIILTTFSRVFSRQFTLLSLFIILLGLILGPIIGTNYQSSYNVNAELKVTDAIFDPTLGIELSVSESTTTEIIYSSQIGLVNYTTSIILTDEEHFWTFFNNFENLSKAYQNESISYMSLVSQYNQLVQEAKKGAYFQEDLVNKTNERGIDIVLNKTSSQSKVYFMALISYWNTSKSFVYSANLELIYTYNRNREQLEGAVLTIIGTIFIVIDQSINIFSAKTRKRSESKTKD